MKPLEEYVAAVCEERLVRAHFPAHQGRLDETSNLTMEALTRDVPYVRRSTIRQAEAAIAESYGARASFFLTNGASQGLLAACLTLARRTRSVAIAADCHVAIARGLVLADLAPVVVPSERAAPTSAEILAFLDDNPPPALVLTAPSYRGERVDVERIATRCRALGVDLVIDEVHGTSFRWTPGAPPTALDAPCELVIHSPHKYAGALVQGGLLHLPLGSRWSLQEVRAALDLLDTTSRSNLIQLSVEAAVNAYLPGGALQTRMSTVLGSARALAAAIDAWDEPALARDRTTIDPWKLAVRSDRTSGFDLARRLLARGVDHEYANVDEVLLVFSPAHDPDDFRHVTDALSRIRDELRPRERYQFPGQLPMPPRHFACRPRDVFLATGTSSLPIERARGLVSCDAVIRETPKLSPTKSSAKATRGMDPRLPPGAPAVFPGERISDWHLQVIDAMHSITVLEPDTMSSTKTDLPMTSVNPRRCVSS